MAERADPHLKGFQNKYFGFKKNKYRENLYNRYLFCNDYIKDEVVLDIPCGMGWGTSMLEGAKELYGIDISEDAINKGKKLYPNIIFQVGELTKINFEDNKFDVVLCLEGFEHITYIEGQKFLSEAKKILKAKGKLILTTPLLKNNKLHSGNPYHLCEYKEEEFYEAIAKNDFKILFQDFLTAPEGKILRVVLENDK